MPAQAQGLCHGGLQAVDVAQAFSLCALQPPDNQAFVHSPLRSRLGNPPLIRSGLQSRARQQAVLGQSGPRANMEEAGIAEQIGSIPRLTPLEPIS